MLRAACCVLCAVCVRVRVHVYQIGTVRVPIHTLLGAKGKQKKSKAHKVELSSGARWSREKDSGKEGGEKYEDTGETPHRQESVQEAKERMRKLNAAKAKGVKRKSFSELAHLQRSKTCTLTMNANTAPVTHSLDLFLVRYVLPLPPPPLLLLLPNVPGV